MGKGENGGGIEPTMTIYGHALCRAVEWCRAGGQGQMLTCWQVQGREPKTGQQKVQLYYKDEPFSLSRYIIYLCGALSLSLYLEETAGGQYEADQREEEQDLDKAEVLVRLCGGPSGL